MNFLQNRAENMLARLTILCHFKTHPSTVKIKKHFRIKTTFSFSPTSKAVIKDLQNNKAAGGEIPLNISKQILHLMN